MAGMGRKQTLAGPEIGKVRQADQEVAPEAAVEGHRTGYAAAAGSEGRFRVDGPTSLYAGDNETQNECQQQQNDSSDE